MIEMAQQTQGTTESPEAIPAEIDSKDEGEQGTQSIINEIELHSNLEHSGRSFAESAPDEQLQQQSPQDSRMKELEQTLIREVYLPIDDTTIHDGLC